MSGVGAETARGLLHGEPPSRSGKLSDGEHGEGGGQLGELGGMTLRAEMIG